MGIAMFTVSNFFAPLQGVISWFMSTPTQGAPASRRPAPQRQIEGFTRQPFRPAFTNAGKSQPSRNVQSTRTCATKPLRVLRVVEANHAPASAGRMMISGRMADVCAELDRLAALETSRH